MNFTGGVRVVKGNPVITGTLPEKQMADFTERIAEVIKKKVFGLAYEEMVYKDLIDQAAAEVIKLVLAELDELEDTEITIPLTPREGMKIGRNGCLAEVRRRLNE